MHKTYVLKVCVRVNGDLQDFSDAQSAESVVKNQLLNTNLFDLVTTEWQGVIRTEKNELGFENA